MPIFYYYFDSDLQIYWFYSDAEINPNVLQDLAALNDGNMIIKLFMLSVTSDLKSVVAVLQDAIEYGILETCLVCIDVLGRTVI